MACKKCGSGWATKAGSDCKSCPFCCKLQRHKARTEGRWIEPTAKKMCEECGIEFTAVGLQCIATQVTCQSQACKTVRRKKKLKAAAKQRAAGVYARAKYSAPNRYCGFSGCRKKLTKREQKEYCGKPCYFAAVDAGEQRFKGRLRDAWAGLVDWAHEWESQRPHWINCEACGKQVERQGSMHKVCSEACRYRLQNPLHERCLDCNAELNADTRYVRRCKLCKRKRRNRLKKIAGKTPRNRCRRHGVPCDPNVKSRAVFERDKYICQLCYRQCLYKFTIVDGMPDPRSPTVDHIIAIALGIKGHTWDNVQCACWQCNVAKGASARGQMRLVMS